MKDSTSQPLRGEAAYRAELSEIGKRNDAARAAGVRRRGVKEATAAKEVAQRERREARGLPQQPGR
jgi:hypothetical protein